MKSSTSDLEAAYSACRKMARRHYENFPVASLLVPRKQRDALAAIYAFARSADDFADEPGVEGRLEALAGWRRKLYQCVEGQIDDPIFLALADTIHKYRLSVVNLDNLIRAFEMDVTVNRHQDLASLSRMSYSILRAALLRAASVGRILASDGGGPGMRLDGMAAYFHAVARSEGLCLDEYCETLLERPPMRIELA